MRFSQRTSWEPGVNAWAAAVETARHAHGETGQSLLDLTSSNPTACGMGLPPSVVLPPLADPLALRYLPDPLGMVPAREAVCRYYAEHGAHDDPTQILLTTSTSEGYSFLFRLLCDPGDEVLIARPGYPLFDLLAQLHDIHLREYPLFLEPGTRHQSGWFIDKASLEAAITSRTRILVLVHPNNPTGHYASQGEMAMLQEICADRGIALVVDEVFLDYRHGPEDAQRRELRSFAGETSCLTFVLSGISKICALPQMKASWVLVSGPSHFRTEAMRRLEIIADTFLSMNAPVQFALGTWLKQRKLVQTQILERIRSNLSTLDRRLKGSLAERFACEGGWTAILRVPRAIDGLPFAEAALAAGVVVQPGHLYGLGEGCCVLSLLTEPEIWDRGLASLPLG